MNLSPVNDMTRRKPMSIEEMKQKVNHDPDFIALPKYQYSLKKFLQHNPNGTNDFKIIADALLITEEEARSLYESALKTFKQQLDSADRAE